MKHLFTITLCFLTACAGPPDAEGDKQEVKKERTVVLPSPKTFSVKERQTVGVPGSNDMIRIYVGDITGNHVVTRIMWKQGREKIILAESLRQGQIRTLDIDGYKYRLQLEEFDTDGTNDFVVFNISSLN